LEINGTIVSA